MDRVTCSDVDQRWVVLGVLSAPNCDIGLVGLEMTLLVERVGQQMTPDCGPQFAGCGAQMTRSRTARLTGGEYEMTPDRGHRRGERMGDRFDYRAGPRTGFICTTTTPKTTRTVGRRGT